MSLRKVKHGFSSFYQIFAVFDDFSKFHSIFSVLHFEKSSNSMLKIWQKMKKISTWSDPGPSVFSLTKKCGCCVRIIVVWLNMSSYNTWLQIRKRDFSSCWIIYYEIINQWKMSEWKNSSTKWMNEKIA